MSGGRNTTAAGRTRPWTWPVLLTSSGRHRSPGTRWSLWAPADLEPVTHRGIQPTGGASGF